MGQKIKKRNLLPDIPVSEIGLGTMNFGHTVSEGDAQRQLDAAYSQGINLIDTAETYPFPPTASNYGLSERYIGNWFKKSGNRANVLLTTKIAGPSPHLNYVRNGNLGFDQNNINVAVDDSLRRLQTDYIDILFLHWPNRATNTLGQLDYKPAQKERSAKKVKDSILETLSALENTVAAGKVRFLALSNETPWGVMQFLTTARENGLPEIIAIEEAYHLLNRRVDLGLAEVVDREQLGLFAYSPLAFGLLSSKHHQPHGILDDSRLNKTRKFHPYLSENCIRQAKKYIDLAARYNMDPAQMSIAYLLTRGYVTSVLVAASKLNQLEANIDATQIELPKDLINAIDKIHRQFPNPCL